MQHAPVQVMRLPNPNAPVVEPVPAPPEEYTGTTPLLDLTQVSFEEADEPQSGAKPVNRSSAWLFR